MLYEIMEWFMGKMRGGGRVLQGGVLHHILGLSE